MCRQNCSPSLCAAFHARDKLSHGLYWRVWIPTSAYTFDVSRNALGVHFVGWNSWTRSPAECEVVPLARLEHHPCGRSCHVGCWLRNKAASKMKCERTPKWTWSTRTAWCFGWQFWVSRHRVRLNPVGNLDLRNGEKMASMVVDLVVVDIASVAVVVVVGGGGGMIVRAWSCNSLPIVQVKFGVAILSSVGQGGNQWWLHVSALLDYWKSECTERLRKELCGATPAIHNR